MGFFDWLLGRRSSSTPQDANQDASSTFSSDSPAGAAQQTCPAQRQIRGRFNPARIKCGSPVELQADAQNIPDATTTNFQLQSLPAHLSTGDTASAPLRNHQVRNLNWTSKKPASRQTPEMDFRVSAGGVSNTSENQLSFHRYPNQARQTRSARMRSGRFGWDKKYDIEFRDNFIIVTVKIKLQNMQGPRPAEGAAQPAVGSPVSTLLKDQYTRTIVNYLSQKFFFHRQQCRRGNGCDCPRDRACCKIRVQVRVQFVESGQHHVVRLYTGSGRANSAEWFRVKTWPHEDAHETGHLLGWYDEYAGGATASAPWHVHDNVMMSTGPGMEPYYYQDFKDWWADKTNEPWNPIRT